MYSSISGRNQFVEIKSRTKVIKPPSVHYVRHKNHPHRPTNLGLGHHVDNNTIQPLSLLQQSKRANPDVLLLSFAYSRHFRCFFANVGLPDQAYM